MPKPLEHGVLFESILKIAYLTSSKFRSLLRIVFSWSEIRLERSIFGMEQSMKPNLLINIKTGIQLGPLVTYEGGTQVLGSPKFLLV